MIFPDDRQLLGGIAEALKDTVLPDLARGSAARKQLQAAVETLRRMAFAAPERDAALAADVADMAEVIARIEGLLDQHSPPPNVPHRGGGLGGGEIGEQHLGLQQKLAELQATIPAELTTQITPLLTQLYARMTDRALALIPPPMPRTPRSPA